MKEIEIYSTDLTEEAKQKILAEYGVDVDDYNWDVFPMVTLYIEED